MGIPRNEGPRDNYVTNNRTASPHCAPVPARWADSLVVREKQAATWGAACARERVRALPGLMMVSW
jgi:hypothetical protein